MNGKHSDYGKGRQSGQRNGSGNDRGNNQNGKGKQSDRNKPPLKEVTLPYHFIPFPGNGEDSDYLQYEQSKLPSHLPIRGRDERLSGSIRYQLKPCTPLAVELRKDYEDKPFLAGSMMRGKLRSNAEILSASAPDFIDRTEMLYRDLAGEDKETYRYQLMCNSVYDPFEMNDDSELDSEVQKEKQEMDQTFQIENVVRAGYLHKKGNDFFLIPAKPIGSKNFSSVKEHQLKKWNLSLNRSWLLYDKKSLESYLELLNEIEKEINQISEQIKGIRFQNKHLLSVELENHFKTVFIDQFSFTQMSRKKMFKISEWKHAEIDTVFQELDKIEKLLLEKLLRKCSKSDILTDLAGKSAQRWGLKARMYILYEAFIKKNREFQPYESGEVYYQTTDNGTITSISRAGQKEHWPKGRLFNSTNAFSKRSHYVIGEPVDDKTVVISQEEINSYNLFLSKIRPNKKGKSSKEFRKFYDLFEYESKWKEGRKIVFFLFTGKKMLIGRTPYFKVPYKHQLNDLLGTPDGDRIDYANALFGYAARTSSKKEAPESYKSRVRFSPIHITGKPQVNDKNFQLLTPYASASRMYLQQPERKKGKASTYAQKEKPKLNGRKYYHILNKSMGDTEPKIDKKDTGRDSLLSTKRVLQPDGIKLSGEIAFSNLTKDELGLLILALDISQLHRTSEYKDKVGTLGLDVDNLFESIGGAKPYGFGKVQVFEIKVQLEPNDNSFEALMYGHSEECQELSEEQVGTYVDAFLNSIYEGLKPRDYFKHIHFKRYLKSKQVFEPGVNWHNLQDKINKETNKDGGYPTNWVLKPL
ncbi:hypothetical protein IDH44_17830 [Paenibacillus sp. IB182496]|uniref:TIGR03986 family CRISPR-associated RAMP protein n=1 Tax=Paenibacillus sabuli TaxID=2772509 RepID=A0A927BUH4_9BACL|nr:hypothetical protein [Paenibacillus sabuli]MBD2847061.1 hypothetical protein [Paenibacillus sabuli]